MKRKSCRMVFFDAGHTLIYAYPSLGEVYARVTQEFGPSVAPERFLNEFLTAFQRKAAAFAKDPASAVSSDAQDRQMWLDITRDVYDRLPEMHSVSFPSWFGRLYATFGQVESWQLYPEAAGVLSALKKGGVRLAIVSNWDSRLNRIVRGLGLMEWMDFALISAEVGYRKPHPMIFGEALRRAGIPPEETAHVGDSYEEDVLGARAMGIHPVLVDRRNRYAGVDGITVVPDLKGLADILI